MSSIVFSAFLDFVAGGGRFWILFCTAVWDHIIWGQKKTDTACAHVLMPLNTFFILIFRTFQYAKRTHEHMKTPNQQQRSAIDKNGLYYIHRQGAKWLDGTGGGGRKDTCDHGLSRRFLKVKSHELLTS